MLAYPLPLKTLLQRRRQLPVIEPHGAAEGHSSRQAIHSFVRSWAPTSKHSCPSVTVHEGSGSRTPVEAEAHGRARVLWCHGVTLARVPHTSSDTLFISMNGKIHLMREEIFYMQKMKLDPGKAAGCFLESSLLPPCLCFLLSTGHPVSMAAKVCLDAGSLLGSGCLSWVPLAG